MSAKSRAMPRGMSFEASRTGSGVVAAVVEIVVMMGVASMGVAPLLVYGDYSIRGRRRKGAELYRRVESSEEELMWELTMMGF